MPENFKPTDEDNQLIFHPDEKIRLMLVDDEEAILRSLQRVFRGKPFEVNTFTSAVDALEFLKTNTIDVIVSDMRMPVMDGLEFLTRVSEMYPSITRLVLSGYADLESVLDVVNKVKIYSFITKPWDETDITLKVKNAAEKKYMKYYIQSLVRQRNDELKSMNEVLERKVRERTAELEQSHRSAIQMIAYFAEQGRPLLQNHASNVSKLASRFGEYLGMDQKTLCDLVSAARLHDIGLAVLPEELLTLPPEEMTDEQKEDYYKHPVLGEKTLMSMSVMHNVATIVRHHHELFNGEGFPDRVKGELIPVGSRMLKIVDDYDNMTSNRRFEYRFSEEEALNVIRDNAFDYYDPRLAKEFYTMMKSGKSAGHLADKQIWRLTVDELKPGMKLFENLMSNDGMLLLTEGQVLSDKHIRSLRHVEDLDGKKLEVNVLKD
jgi:response regulator RpfG family c-di-GMP phosphodiesterase